MLYPYVVQCRFLCACLFTLLFVQLLERTSKERNEALQKKAASLEGQLKGQKVFRLGSVIIKHGESVPCFKLLLILVVTSESFNPYNV